MTRRDFLRTAVTVAAATALPAASAPQPIYKPSPRQIAFFDTSDHAIDAVRCLYRGAPARMSSATPFGRMYFVSRRFAAVDLASGESWCVRVEPKS